MADTYRIVTTRLRRIEDKAIMVDAPPARRDREVWIPWSLISGADTPKIHRGMIGQEVTFRVFEWKAEQMGFPG